MNERFLPLGTVVLLKNGTKRIMICGRLEMREYDQKIFDYLACYYPEGILNPDEMFLFNHDDIKEVMFLGFQDQEEADMQKYLSARVKYLDL